MTPTETIRGISCKPPEFVSFGNYLHSKNKPIMANATPKIRCHDGASRKNKMPATAIIAAPPAKIAGVRIKHGSDDRIPEPACHETGV